MLVLLSWELASTLKEAMPKFDSAGVKLIAVGVGTPDKARILAERVSLKMFLFYIFQDELFICFFVHSFILKLREGVNWFFRACSTI